MQMGCNLSAAQHCAGLSTGREVRVDISSFRNAGGDGKERKSPTWGTGSSATGLPGAGQRVVEQSKAMESRGWAVWVCRREVLGVLWPSSTMLPPQPSQHCSQPRHTRSRGAAVAPYLWLCFPELNSTMCDNQN